MMEEITPVKFKLSERREADIQQHGNDLKEFKRSTIFKALEQAVLLGEDIIEREDQMQLSDTQSIRKLELESDQGASQCRSYLQCIERLYDILCLEPVKKEYRLKFSKAYKVLYES